MERGLLWLPLLAAFIGLAWAGWNEYQKLEEYRRWATGFQRAKYDIYAVLRQQGSELTWGKATRKGIVAVQTFSLETVRAIALVVNHQTVDLNTPPERGRSVELVFQLPDTEVRIPFTQISLAAKWGQVLYQDWQGLTIGQTDEQTDRQSDDRR